MAEEKFATSYDGPWKDALDHAPELFLKRFLPKVAAAIDWTERFDSLDDELRQLGVQDQEGLRRVDRLLLFKTLEGDPLYLHIEVQCRFDKDLGRRVMSYRHRLRGRFGKPVVTVIVFGDRRRKWCPRTHTEGQFGSGDICRWKPVKLLRVGKKNPDLENEDNPFSLFIAAHLSAQATRKDLPKRQEAKLRLLSNLQRRKLEESDGREWYRLIDHLMKLPEEMNRQVHEELYRQHTEEPMKYVSFAERQGIEKGIEKGQRETLERLLARKFGPLSEAAKQRLASFSTQRLSEVEEKLLTVTSLRELGLEDGAEASSQP